MQSGAVLALAFSSIMILDWRRATRDFGEMEDNIRAGLDSKGRMLNGNLSMMIRSLVEDNSIANIREIVDSLADRDPEIAYAAYVDAELRPWAFRSRIDYGRGADMREILRDTISLWAAQAVHPQSRVWNAAEGEIIEFASPVISASGKTGVVRVGLDARSMRAALENANEHVWQNRRLTLEVFLAAAACAFLLSLWFSRIQSGRLTRPVLDLATMAQRMAAGDYGTEFNLGGEGEIALLAETFETMRRKIQAYTLKLESLVAEKVRQIGDLLENVDQGLFTFNLDMIVNPDYSARACSVLRLEKLDGKPLEEVLRMNSAQAKFFRDWIEVVREGYRTRRWAKLLKLSPVREIILDQGDKAASIIEIDYRKILDAEGRLAKIMVLAQDVTERRALERRLEVEKIRHESRVKIVLGVAGHAEEAVAEFLKDVGRRLDSMLEAVRVGGSDWKRRIFFDCHTLKGNSSSFGFDTLAQAAQELEGHLETLRGEPDDASNAFLRNSLWTMDGERCKIEEVYRMLYGSLEKPPIRLDPDKVERLRALAEKAKAPADPKAMQELVAACLAIRKRAFSSLAFKYKEISEQTAQRLGKEVDFIVSPPEAELDPALVFRVDEALGHILRNALAHGIEDPEIRARQGKGIGRVELSYSRTAQGHVFSIQDDGKGIDGEAVVAKAVALGLVTPLEAAGLTPMEQMQLIFKSGLSTALEADIISGRGQGLAIAWEKVRAEGGELTVECKATVGTRFTIVMPEPLPEGSYPETLAKGLSVTT